MFPDRGRSEEVGPVGPASEVQRLVSQKRHGALCQWRELSAGELPDVHQLPNALQETLEEKR